MGKKLGSFLLVLFFAACITVLISIMPKFLSQMDAYQLAFWTCIFIFIPLNIIHLFVRAFGIRLKNTGSILISLGASLFLFGGFAFFALSVSSIGFNSSLALVMLFPFLFLIVVPLITKESINAAQVVGIILTAAGAFCILYARGLVNPGSWESISYVIGAAACWTVFSLLALKTKAGIHTNVYIYVVVGLIASTIVMFIQSSFILPEYSNLFTLLAFGALAATIIYLWAGTFRISSASFWASMVFILPAVILSYELIFKSASLPVMGIIGLGITGLAVIYRLSIKM